MKHSKASANGCDGEALENRQRWNLFQAKCLHVCCYKLVGWWQISSCYSLLLPYHLESYDQRKSCSGKMRAIASTWSVIKAFKQCLRQFTNLSHISITLLVHVCMPVIPLHTFQTPQSNQSIHVYNRLPIVHTLTHSLLCCADSHIQLLIHCLLCIFFCPVPFASSMANFSGSPKSLDAFYVYIANKLYHSKKLEVWYAGEK